MVRRIGAFFFTLALVACGSSSDSALTGNSGGTGGSAEGGAAGQAGEGGSSGSTEAGGQGGSVSSGGAVSGGQGGSSTPGGASAVGGSSQGGGGQGGGGQGGGGQGGSAQGGSAQGGSAGVGAFSAGGSAGVGGSSGGGSAGGGQGGTSPNGQGVVGCGDADCRLFEGAACCLTENPGNYCFALNPNQPGNLPERCDCEGILCDSVELFCDGPEDCPGQVCCFEQAPASEPTVECRASCEGQVALRRDAVCKLGQANACPGGGQCQMEGSLPQGIGTCR